MEFFDRAYEGMPPWEIGRPQPEFARRCDLGEIRGRVLDVGCGTGENAIYFADHGHPTWGVDFAPRAIALAQGKAERRGLALTLRVANALGLEELGAQFDTVTDCGLFHTLSDAHRPVYAASVASVLARGGRLYVLCFSDEEPADWGGPRRVTREELRHAFREGYRERSIVPAHFATRVDGVRGRAWMARFDRP